MKSESDRLAGEIAAAKVTQKAMLALRTTAGGAAEIRQANAALEGLQARLALTQSQLAAVRSQQRTLLSQKGVHDALLQQRDAAEQAYFKVLTQINDAQIDADLGAAGLTNVKVIQNPLVPAKPVSLPPLTLAALAAGLGFMAGLAIIITVSMTSAAPRQNEIVWRDLGEQMRAEHMRAPPVPAGAAIQLLPMAKRSSFGLGETGKYRMKQA